MLERCAGRAGASDSAIGRLPRPEDLDLHGLDLAPQALAALLAVDPTLWCKEVSELREYLGTYGKHLPRALLAELDNTERGLG
jgi:phosphoenolpyruvate carboxykinase (GTP)